MISRGSTVILVCIHHDLTALYNGKPLSSSIESLIWLMNGKNMTSNDYNILLQNSQGSTVEIDAIPRDPSKSLHFRCGILFTRGEIVFSEAILVDIQETKFNSTGCSKYIQLKHS